MQKEIEFIKQNINSDISKLILSKNKFKNINIEFCTIQINSRQKIKNKLPTWYDNYDLIMPHSLNLEQTSSEKTAELKSKNYKGKTAIDLTGGFGIDTYYLSKSFNKVIYIEPNKLLYEIVKYNFKILNINNVEFINSTAEEYINIIQENIDLIYLDPSRRNENKKTFKLEETLPNPLEIIPKLVNNSKNILIKISPLFDINLLLKSIKNINNISVISVKNECKEILISINNKNIANQTNFIAYNFDKKWENINYNSNDYEIEYSLPKKYIYEPNSSIHKLQCYKVIAEKYNLCKLHQNSHLFTSDDLIDFQGRVFEIIGIEKLNSKKINKYLTNNQANITIRNFPLTSEKIKDKLKIKDGGDIYLFATTDINNNKKVLVCKKSNLR